jgi:RimJ/RimL family protein N-acetyltransferase
LNKQDKAMLDLPKFYYLKNETLVFVRLFRPSDMNQIIIGFNKMSDRSRYRRFFQPVRTIPESHLKELMRVDGNQHLAICAGVIQKNGWEGAGIVRLARDGFDSKTADLALTVIDKYQGMGLGSLLIELITRMALEKGVSNFEGHVLPDNTAMIKILRRYNAQNRLIEGPVLRFRMPLRIREMTVCDMTDRFEHLYESLS